MIGFDSQFDDQQVGRFANLSDGRLVAGGFWYSPLKTLLFKLPGGSLLLLVAASCYWARNLPRLRAGEGIVWVVPLTLIGFLCTQGGGLNFAYRYVLPALPLLLIAVGKLVEGLWGLRLGRMAIVACLLWNGAAVLSIRPGYLSFGNELAGGPGGPRRCSSGATSTGARISSA